MPADEEIAGLSVVVSAEVVQVLKALTEVAKHFEVMGKSSHESLDEQIKDTKKTEDVIDVFAGVFSADAQQIIANLQEMEDGFKDFSEVAKDSFAGLGNFYSAESQEMMRNMQEIVGSMSEEEIALLNNQEKHEKHSASVMESLKKIGIVWTAITGAAIGGVYGLLRAASYGSLYFGQWGAIMKDVMNTFIRPIIPLLNAFTNEFRKLAEIFKKESAKDGGLGLLSGAFAAISLAISDVWTWIGELDLKWQILIGVFAAVVLAAVSLVLIFTGTLGIAIAIGVVIAAIWTFKDELGWLKDKLFEAMGAAKDFVDKGLEYIVTYLSNLTWPEISNPFDLDYLSGIADWVLSVLGLGAYNWTISWPTITNPFADFTWCSVIPGWVASVLGICDDKAVAPVVNWPEITDPFAGVFDTITDFAADAATYGGTLIDNLVSGISAGMPSLTDAVSGITDTLSGIGEDGGDGGGGGGGEGHWVERDLSNAQKRALNEQYMAGGLTHDEWYQALHEWVGSGDAEEIPQEPSRAWDKVVTSIYGAEGVGWGGFYKRPGERMYEHSLGKTNEELRLLIDGMYVMQSVWDIMSEKQQQNLMASHGGVVDDSTEEITQQFEKGGYVPSTSTALVHGGEYVVPRGGTLVKEGSSGNVTIAPVINLTVNNGTQKDSRALADEISRILSTEIRRMVKT